MVPMRHLRNDQKTVRGNACKIVLRICTIPHVCATKIEFWGTIVFVCVWFSFNSKPTATACVWNVNFCFTKIVFIIMKIILLYCSHFENFLRGTSPKYANRETIVMTKLIPVFVFSYILVNHFSLSGYYLAFLFLYMHAFFMFLFLSANSSLFLLFFQPAGEITLEISVLIQSWSTDLQLDHWCRFWFRCYHE